MPPPLGRDAVFYHHCSQDSQIEFVVDNFTVSGLANATVAITNAKHEQTVHNIRRALWNIFRRGFQYKGGYLNPVDWRAREWNTGADFLVKHAMMTRSSGSTLSLDILAQHIHQATALQFFSDGGFTEGLGGAYGVQLLAHAGHGRIVVGYLYKFSAQATSAFEMELKGLEAAVGILCHGNPSRGANLQQKK